MKNSKGIVIEPGQVWKHGTPHWTVVAVREETNEAWIESGEDKIAMSKSNYFDELIKSSDGADLEAARAEGWDVWVEGMEKPSVEKVETVETFTPFDGWEAYQEPKQASYMAEHAYRYKLKEEQPKYKLFEIDWMQNIWPMTSSGSVIEVGRLVENYRIFGFTDDEEWTLIDATCYDGEEVVCDWYANPCDHTGNRKYAIGRFENGR